MKKVIVLFLIALLCISCGKKEDNVIKIGVILPLTGDRGAYGNSSKNGITLAINEINNQNTKYKLYPIFEDCRSQAKDG
jgi:ABC-type branched-subunit amino acid transport system substrate-binding protein